MRKQLFFFAASLLLGGFVFALAVSGRMSTTARGVAEPSVAESAVPQARSQSAPVLSGLPDLSPVAERALLVAANISSTTRTRLADDPISRYFFGDQVQVSNSLGSGVVVREDGYVLTNSHVIGNAGADIRVTLPDGRELPGQLVGIDDVTDLAVIKVEAKGLQTLPWGDSSKLRVAEWVLAIGNPFQLSGTVTLGIVSTVSRSGEQVGAYANFIQTDAAINQGNSGGALVNGRGELVGINSMIYSETGGNIGLGFAIPSNLARQIMDELIKHGEVPWGSVGDVTWVTVDPMLARRFRLAATSGVLLYSMGRNSSAALAGLRPGDIVTAVDGKKVTTGEQLDRLIVGLEVGKKTTFTVTTLAGENRRVDVNVVTRQQGAPRRR